MTQSFSADQLIALLSHAYQNNFNFNQWQFWDMIANKITPEILIKLVVYGAPYYTQGNVLALNFWYKIEYCYKSIEYRIPYLVWKFFFDKDLYENLLKSLLRELNTASPLLALNCVGYALKVTSPLIDSKDDPRVISALVTAEQRRTPTSEFFIELMKKTDLENFKRVLQMKKQLFRYNIQQMNYSLGFCVVNI